MVLAANAAVKTMNVLNPKLYAKITGFALLATALLGIVMEFVGNPHGNFMPNFLTFDWTHDILHVVLGAIALAAGFLAGGAYAKIYARLFGIVYTGLAIAGFVNGYVINALGVQLELGENLVHTAIGVWGLAAGFMGTTDETTTTPTRRTA
ncbi:MAG: DUF4383 domain-containing protein [bacterium]